MSEFVAEHKPNLMFIHFDSIDESGHKYTWGSTQYYDAVKVHITGLTSPQENYELLFFLQAVDGYIGEIMTAFESAGIYNETLFMLTADHGG